MKKILFCLLIGSLQFSRLNAQLIVYPSAKKSDQKDNYFGLEIKDPYRWLEDDQSSATKDWVLEENKVTSSYLSHISFRDSLKTRMTALWNYPKYTSPFKAGHRYFYFKNDGLQNQPVLYMMRGLNYVPMAYFDPNKLSDDGTLSISQLSASKDGKYMTFVLSKAGSDWNELRIKDVSTMKTLPEILSWVKFSNIAWKDSGFFYSRYDAPTTNAYSKRNEVHQVFYHRLNTPQASDSLVFMDYDHPLRTYTASTTQDEKFLIIKGSESTSGENLYIQNLTKEDSKLIEVVKNFDHDYTLVGNTNDNIIFLTNHHAPKNRLLVINAQNPKEENWKELVPESDNILLNAVRAGNKLVLHYLSNAVSRLYIYNLKGIKESEVPLPGLGTVSEINGSINDSVFFFNYTTFTSPGVIYKFSFGTNRLYTQFKPVLPFKPEDYKTDQVFYISRDGTKIPMFIVHKKELKPDANTPTLLFGYGGFNISKTPEFKPERMVFLEQGGIFAMPNIRGGGEFGEAWHKAGTKLKKQNVFDDFIAAAEYLIKQKYTSPGKLAISGRSNGGLLVGACMLQRPDLFKVALPAVGVMDMLRYQKFTIGWSWAVDFGTSDNEEEFKALYQYSPLHNIKEGINYPATFITTADHDDRVVPAHSFKFAATLQEKYKGANPQLIRIDTNAGHGSGKPTSKQIDEQADVFSFMFYNLGMTFK